MDPSQTVEPTLEGDTVHLKPRQACPAGTRGDL